MPTITVNSPKSQRVIELDLDTRETLSEAVEAFGEEAVFSLYQRMFLTDAGNKARVLLNDPENSEEKVLEIISAFKPGVKRVAGPKKKRDVTAAEAEAALPTMDPEALKRLLEKAKAQLAALEG
jgi:hypothetical protein